MTSYGDDATNEVCYGTSYDHKSTMVAAAKTIDAESAFDGGNGKAMRRDGKRKSCFHNHLHARLRAKHLIADLQKMIFCWIVLLYHSCTQQILLNHRFLVGCRHIIFILLSFGLDYFYWHSIRKD